jgi:oligopeptidase B
VKARFGVPRDAAPAARREDHVSHWHGQAIADPYRWLRADNWQAVLDDAAALPAEIRNHLVEENNYIGKVMRPLAASRKHLVTEMRGRMREDEIELPEHDGPFSYSHRFEVGAEHGRFERQPRGGGPVELLFDGEKESKGKPYFDCAGHFWSPDHRLLASLVDHDGAEINTLQVWMIKTGKVLESLVGVHDTVIWLSDSRGYLYGTLNAHFRADKIWLHRLGEPQSADRLILSTDNPAQTLSLGETMDGRYALIGAADMASNEIHLFDLHAPDTPLHLVRPQQPEVQYDVEHDAGCLIVHTNLGIDNFAIMQTRDLTFQDQQAEHLVSGSKDVFLVEMALLKGHLVWLERENALPRLMIRDRMTGQTHHVAFDEEAYSLWFDEGLEWESEVITIHYESMTRPQESWSYNLRTRERHLLKRQDIPSGHEPADYTTRRLHAFAPDGEDVPITLLMRADAEKNAQMPVLLHGYGAYGMSSHATFWSDALALVDRGWIVAHAHVRGGQEKGRRWYQDARYAGKQNSMSDFIAVAQHLVADGYTSAGRIVAFGGSAGGLLVAAVANQAPELFAGIIAEVPFVDVLNTMMDETLPQTPVEWDEWGNPIKDKAIFDAIRAYSPCDNVTAKVYPPILATAGLRDPRVIYWEPAKWIARLRAEGQGGPFLLKTDLTSGHFGAAGRFAALADTALIFAFALAALAKASSPNGDARSWGDAKHHRETALPQAASKAVRKASRDS